MKISFVIFFFIYFCAPLSGQNYEPLDDKLKLLQETSGLPGFAIAKISADGIVYEQGFGYADLKTEKPFEINTILNIGSTSKTFIAVSIMQLVEAGKLSLGMPVNDIIPFNIVHPKFPEIEITLDHIVTHTSGIKDAKNYGNKAYVLRESLQDIDPSVKGLQKMLVKRYAKNELEPMDQFLESYLVKDGAYYTSKNFTKSKPGEVYEYSNVGSVVGALIVEKISGEDYKSYVINNILKPIGMEDSGWDFEKLNMDQHATLYFDNNAVIPRYSLTTFPDGGLISSCHDLSLYLIEMMNGYAGSNGLMDVEIFKEMMEVRFVGKEDKVGVFWVTTRRQRIGHNGGDPGIFTMIEFDPKTQEGFVFVSNTLPIGRKNRKKMQKVGEILGAMWRYEPEEN